MKKWWSGRADHLKVIKTLFSHAFKATYMTGWKPVPAGHSCRRQEHSSQKDKQAAQFPGERVKIDKRREGKTQIGQCHTSKGDMTANALVTHGHFSKDFHTESDCQEKARIRGGYFRTREQHRLRKGPAAGKPDKSRQPVRPQHKEQRAHPGKGCSSHRGSGRTEPWFSTPAAARISNIQVGLHLTSLGSLWWHVLNWEVLKGP